MPRSSKAAELKGISAIAAVIILAFAACKVTPPGPPQPPPPLNLLTLLPTDPSATCVVTPAVFKTWFGGTVTLNGVVNPANSVTFANVPNCSFYQWAKQMFLWLTSPAPPTYGGGGGLIVDSPTFFDVSPPAADGSRTFVPHAVGFIRPFALRSAQVGPQGLQLIFAPSGTPFQVQPAAQGATPIVINTAGQRVQVVHVRLGERRKLILLDKDGKVIHTRPSPAGKPTDRAAIRTITTVQEFVIDGFPIFIGPSQDLAETEQGQADNGVLEAQLPGGSLVYFATIVNDVYAYFATGVKDAAISASQFPTTVASLSAITALASAHGTTSIPVNDPTCATAIGAATSPFPDPCALAVEVKSAWVQAAGLPNLSSYITINASIPTYTPSCSPPPAGTTECDPTGAQQTVQLALVGMHVVGSVAGHPEMIWATFEHVANAPAATYAYINSSNATVTVSQNVSNLPVIGGTSTNWVFSAPNATAPFNNQNMSFNPPGSLTPPPINSITGTPIAPSNTMRMKSFGAASDVSPNPIDPSSAASNTEIISINNSVSSMLASGDVRNNYVMTGATWTIGGAAPNAFIGGNQVGTSSLSNTTMETYEQGSNTTQQAGSASNCLSCHNNNTTAVSHVFGALKPLF